LLDQLRQPTLLPFAVPRPPLGLTLMPYLKNSMTKLTQVFDFFGFSG